MSSSLTISQDFSQDIFKEYNLDKYFSLQAITAGTRIHIANLIFDQKVEMDTSKNPPLEILSSKCWSESLQKKNKVPSSSASDSKIFYQQKLILSPQNNSIVNSECNCFVRNKKCKHACASILLLSHKRRNNAPINDAPDMPQNVTAEMLQSAQEKIKDLESLLKTREEETAAMVKRETAEKEVQSQQDLLNHLPDPLLPPDSDEPLFTQDKVDMENDTKECFQTPLRMQRRKIHPFIIQEFVSSQDRGDTDYVVQRPTPSFSRKRKAQLQSPSKSTTHKRKSRRISSLRGPFDIKSSAISTPAQRRTPSQSSGIELSQNLKQTIRSLIDQDEDDEEDFIDEKEILKAQSRISPKRRGSVFDFDVREEQKTSRKRKRRDKETRTPMRRRKSFLTTEGSD